MRCINEISRGFKGLPSCLDTLRCVKFTLLIRGAFRLRPMESCKRINEGFNNMAFEGAGGQPVWCAGADGAEFAVSDTGIGIAPEHISRLTERLDRKSTRLNSSH